MKIFLIIAAISGALAVSLGAFGAHILKQLISVEMLEAYKTGIQYQFYHTFAIMSVGLLMYFKQTKSLKWAGYLFTVGIIIFSGFIYLMAITGIKALGIIPAFGGLILISGWICLLTHCIKLTKTSF